MAEIFYNIPFSCSPSRLYEAITSDIRISEWWLRGSKMVAAVGEIGVFPLSDGSGQIHMQIKELDFNKKMTWVCLEHKHLDWIGTQVTFEILEESKDSCAMTVRHSNWKSTEGTYGRVSFFWAALYFRNLKLMVEKI